MLIQVACETAYSVGIKKGRIVVFILFVISYEAFPTAIALELS
jgi:hypothetical protein